MSGEERSLGHLLRDALVDNGERAFPDDDYARGNWQANGLPLLGQAMPDGRSRVESVVVDERGSVEVGFSLAGQVRYRAWPCTNRRAKRQRCKARRRER